MKKSVVATSSFSERMASIKSMFKTAHENAKKESQIAALQEAETFMSNIEKLI